MDEKTGNPRQGQPTPTRLIVNADDYGSTPGVSAGIRYANLRGIVTTTTAMMNLSGVRDDLRLARETCPRLGAGVHLVLTGSRPLRPADSVPSLVTPAGGFPAARDLRAFFPRIDPGQLHDEWRAQIEAFLECGLPLDHLDSHHHASYLHEKLFEVMLTLAQEYAVPVRYPFGPQAQAAATAEFGPELVAAMQAFAPRLLRAHPVSHPDDMIGAFFGDGATLEGLLQILETLPPGTVELMCHPGYADPKLRARSSYSVFREQELAALTDPSVHAVIAQRGIELITFAQLDKENR